MPINLKIRRPTINIEERAPRLMFAKMNVDRKKALKKTMVKRNITR